MPNETPPSALPRVTIYTDGGCKPNPGPGGWGAVVLREGDDPVELHGSAAKTTNNRMELQAAEEALLALEEPSRVDLYTDSTYVRNGITKWLAGWRRKGWVTSSKKPVQNRDLWKKLDEATRRHEVRWHWVEGHAGDRWNERAHELASLGLGKAMPDRPAQTTGPAPDVEAWLGIAWSAKKGVGAWGVVLRSGEHEKFLAGARSMESPNAAHIVSALEALRALKRPTPIRVHSVSDYLVQGASQWVHGWKRSGWTTRQGDPVKNADLWRALDREAARLKVQWHVVDGDAPEEIEEAKRRAKEALEDPAARTP